MRSGAVGAILAVLIGAALGRAQGPDYRPVPAEVPRWALPPQHPEAAPPQIADEHRGRSSFLLGPEPADPAGDMAGSNEPRATLPTQEASADPYVTWGSIAYLFAWVKNGPAPPPLATTGSLADDVPALPGQPGTRLALGNQEFDYGTMSGGQFILGSWLDLHQHCGLEVTGLVLEHRTTSAAVRSDGFGNPPIGRPFVSAQDGGTQVEYVGFPGNFDGVAAVLSSTQVWGLEVNVIDNVLPWRPFGDPHRFWGGDFRAELRGGFRYLVLQEDVKVVQGSDLLAGGRASFLGSEIFPPATVILRDRFATYNQFLGGQLGCKAEYCKGHLTVDLLAELALGDAHQTLTIAGSSVVTSPGFLPAVASGGLLATSTNSGVQRRDEFAVVPQLGLDVSYHISPEVRVFAGYTFLYWNRVVRPGPQIDPVVNISQVPINGSFGPLTGPARPLVPFQESDVWVQGLSLGVEVRF